MLDTTVKMASNHPSNLKAKISQDIVNAIATAVKKNEGLEEIQDMFVATRSFSAVVESWRDDKTGLDLYQTAILSKHCDMVKYLHKLNLFPRYQYLVGIFEDSTDNISINSPLHLACYVGDLNTLKFLLSCVDSYQEGLSAHGKIEYAGCEWELQNTAMIPFEICVAAKHLDCSIYLCQFICKIKEGSSTVLKIQTSSPVHQACYLGAADFLKLLIDKGYQEQIYVRNSKDFLPLHVASACAMPECLEILLQNGANVDAYTDCRSSLHLLYTWNWQPSNHPKCTEILISYGIDVNSIDHNFNAPLDHLAWIYGQKEQINNKHQETCFRLASMHKTCKEVPKQTLPQYQGGVLKCMSLLLTAGAKTAVRTYEYSSTGLEIDHTIMHTLLQNISWPHSSCLLQNPKSVYKALELLFQHGSNPNTVAKTNKISCLTLLILHSLHEVLSVALKCQFTLLCIVNGADLESEVPPPENPRDLHSRIWSVYPVNLAQQEKHPLEVIELMFNFMSPHHVFRAIVSTYGKHSWQYGLMSSIEDGYRKAWLVMRKVLLRQPRTLKHCCKVTIFKKLGLKGGHMDQLPRELRQYLLSQYF